MSYDEFEERHPSGKDIALNEANAALHDSFLDGIGGVVTSDFAHTFELPQEPWVLKTGLAPNQRHLARAAIMMAPGLDDGPDHPETNSPPLLDVVVRADIRHLDQEQAKDLTSDEAAALEVGYYDGLKISLVDHIFSNVTSWTFSKVPGGMPGLSFSGNKAGFASLVDGETVDDPVASALGVRMGGGLDGGPGMTEDRMGYIEPYRIINGVLHQGEPNLAATARLVEVLRERGDTELLTMDMDVVRASTPYFRKLISQAFAAKSFRDMLAWHQYCDTQWGPESDQHN